MIREPLKKVKEVLVVLSVLLEKMEGMWGMFCKASECNVGSCLMHPSSCFNRALFIFLDFVLLVVFLFNVISKVPKLPDHPRCSVISWWQLLSSILNGFIGLVYLFIGIWQWLESEIGENHDVSYPYWWLVVSFHGVTWFIVSLTVSLHGHRFTRAPLRLLLILVFLFSVVNCSLSLFTTIVHKRAYSIKLSVDIFSFLGASLLLLGVYKGFEYEDSHESDLYSPLRDDANESVNEVTPFGKAGFINKMSFWWLNPLMKRGRDAILQEKDVPGLRKDDLAESCYQEFIDLMDKQPSIFWAIVQCHYKEILISGVFAMLKIITLSCGPLVLNAFINVATVRKESFEYEGFVLAVVLFFAKFIESLSQRQWYFRSRLIGLKVKSLLTAAIYKKQLRLSNAAKLKHSTGEIMNYVTVDAYRIGEFPFWLHQTWTLLLQVSLAIVILFRAVGLATIASLVTILLTVLCNTPLAKLQHKFQCKLMEAQDKRLKAISEALSNMKVLKLYAWESHFKNVIEKMRLVEEKCLSTVQSQKAYNCFLFWASPVLVSAATFGACFFLDVPLYTSNVFTFLATLRLVQDPLRTFPDVISVMIQAKTSFSRLVLFLEATELESEGPRKEANIVSTSNHDILIKSADLSWENDSLKPTLRNINLEVAPGQKIAICGEVGSGKSTLLASLLGELPILKGIVQVSGTVAYVSQSAWIQTGSIRDNIIFGSSLDTQKYQDTLEKCSLLDDIELMPYGDLTEIGEKGVNLSGGQKQRIQLARSLYREADIYLLDDPFSAVDAHTATDLFNNYVMGALSRKTVLLVTHQVEFLPAFDFVLLMADGNILHSGTYHELLSSSKEFQDLVNAHKNTSGSDRFTKVNAHPRHEVSTADIQKSIEKSFDAPGGDHLIKKEEREVGDTGFKPYVQYLNKKNGFLLFSLASLAHLMYVICQILQLSWMAEKVDTNISTLRLIMVYLVIGFISTIFLLGKCLAIVVTGLQSSQSLFSQLLSSLFRAPMLFYDSTPIGRIISRVSQDLSIVDLDIPFSLIFAVGATINVYSNLAVLAVVTWQVLFVSIPMVYFALLLQRYYFASAKELMRMNGITKSYVANHVAESIAGAMTIRAFRDEHRFFEKNLQLIDMNASPNFHNFAANEWLIQRLETLSAIVLASSALCMILLPAGTMSPGFVGMALSYGLSLNTSLVFSIQNQCNLTNYLISVERLHQYMYIPSEAPEIINENRPLRDWPTMGRVEIQNLQIRYRTDSPLVLHGITCTFEAGHKIGIVGRTGSGKTTLIGALFRMVEPAAGRIIVDGINISQIGVHDLRSRFGIIPQDPTLFSGTIRYNLDPLNQHTDLEIWEVLGKCQLRESIQEKEDGLDSLVALDGSNWSMGQRQLFCLGRAILRRSKILVLDEATASIDNYTDLIIQETIRTEFKECTVVTVAHRIPTVMDSTMVLAMSDGNIVEYEDPMVLMKRESSLFGLLVKEYWSRCNHFNSE